MHSLNALATIATGGVGVGGGGGGGGVPRRHKGSRTSMGAFNGGGVVAGAMGGGSRPSSFHSTSRDPTVEDFQEELEKGLGFKFTFYISVFQSGFFSLV